MPNQTLTISDITNESLVVLENELVLTKKVCRDYDDRFGEAGAKIGDVINVRKPPRYVPTYGQALQIQDAVETSVPVTLNRQYQQSIAFTSKDLKLSVDDFSKRFIKPAIVVMANAIDIDVFKLFYNVYSEVGVPGQVPNQLLTYLQANQKLNDASVPMEDWTLIINPEMQITIVDALKGIFNPQVKVSGQYEKGEMGKETAGFNWFMSQNCPVFTTGTQGGSPTVNAANQTGASITTAGWTGTTKVLNKGDIVSFDGCYAVNYVGKQTLSNLAQWVVTADVTSAGGGTATIPIAGPDGNGIILTGATQNASAAPTNSGVVHVQGGSAITSARGLAFHEMFGAFACADLPLPDGVDMAKRATDDQLGLSIRQIRAYDINTDRWPTRCDLLGGTGILYPQFAVRVAS